MIPRSAALALFLATSASACRGDRTFDDPRQPIETRPDAPFVIALPSNQSTGYQWVLVDSAALGPLRVVGTRYEVPRRYRDNDGAGGTERWTLRSPAAGQGVVSLIYVRPWEKTAPKDTARFRVTVR
ncbi:MAG TPA: protease inhibitor I42 family protein [Longimicrobium sp.]|nr:protease inhibitor I42 family protein [Longimicrobium sp.]